MMNKPNAFQVIVRYENREYFSTVGEFEEQETLESITDQFYEAIDQADKLKIELADGSFIVLPSESLNRCVIQFKPMWTEA